MNSKCCLFVAVMAALLTGGCGGDEQAAADDTFISDLSSDDYWRNTDRANAIDAGHAFCDAVIDLNSQGKTGIDAVSRMLGRYGLKSGPVLLKAAKTNYCPDVDLG